MYIHLSNSLYKLEDGVAGILLRRRRTIRGAVKAV